jgi:transposase-like protein
MTKDTSNLYGRKDTHYASSVVMVIRARAQALIEAIVQEELAGALGAGTSMRVETRRGYRQGTRARTLTTSLGPTTVAMPRARVQQADGGTTEGRSQAVRRYQRRTEVVDEAVLGVYLSGTNTGRINGALAPLLCGGPLSKDAVSRWVGRLADDFETWRTRDLAGDAIQYLLLDGWFPKVRIGKRRVRVPVLVTLGVRADGERVVLDVRLAGDESTAAWRDVIRRLVERHIGTLQLAIIDGSAGLAAALREQWPSLPIQRCTTHKQRNLDAKAPVRLREELAEDYRRMIYAGGRAAVEQARVRFVRKWKLRGARPSPSVWPRPVTTSSPFSNFRRRNGRRCGPRTRSSASTSNSAGGRRRRRASPAKMRSCCCCLACCGPDT